LKIAFIEVTATTSFGGIQTAVWQLAIALSDLGHEVTLFGGEGAVRADLLGRPVQVRTFRFTPRDKLPNLGSRFRRLMERVTFALHARGTLVEGKFDWAILTKPFDFFWPWILPRGCRTKFAFRSGGTDFYGGDRLLAKRIGAWFANSHFNAWQIHTRYRRYPTVIYNGVNTTIFSPDARSADRRQQLGVSDEEVLFAFAGRLVGWKGLAFAIRAMAAEPLRGVPVKLLIVGEGPEKENLRLLAGQLGQAGRVIFHEAVRHRELPAFYASADVGIFPSLGDEGFSNSIAEMMSCARPVIATAHSGNPETVGNEGSSGILVAPQDPTSLAAAMRELAASAERRREMGLAARKRIATYFTWPQVARRLLDGLERASR
jgi:glycosyltransferase involved in cell wall biosynthesis